MTQSSVPHERPRPVHTMLYVTNPQDTAPKRLGCSEFETLIGSSEVAACCMWARRYAQALEEAKQRGDVSEIAWWERELKGAKGRLPGFIFQGKMMDEACLGKPGTRNGRHVVSNGKVMIDIDHMSRADIQRVTEAILTVCEEDGVPFVERVGLVAMTPSYKGMRIVLNGRGGSSLVGDQHWVAGMLDVTIDECCKDYTRLSFAVPKENILYYAPEVLFAECVPYTESSQSSPSSLSSLSTLSTLSSLSTPSSLMDTYDIVTELEQELGGAPTEGMRNKFVYRMACNLRHLYGDDAEAIYRAIPPYGLSDVERRQTVRSAMHGTLGSYVPRCIYRRVKEL